MRFNRSLLAWGIIFFIFFVSHSPLHAEENGDSLKDQVQDLNSQVKKKELRVKELDGVIVGYKKKIVEQEAKHATLENQVVLLDTRIRTKELDIERAKIAQEALRLEIESLEKDIESQTRRIAKQKDLSAELIRRMRTMDDVSPLEVLLTKKSLSAFFNRLTELKRLEGDLTDTLEKIQNSKKALEAKKADRDAKRIALIEDRRRLTREQLALETERGYKTSLASATKLKQSEFERALYELREQQQSAADDIATLESKLKEKLASIDEALARGDILLNWPITPQKGISAHFHDPTYPFRHLFEHPGTDIPTPVGTSVKAAAGGYVAWTKRGRLYGNYIMIIHPGGIATVYAHLSKFLAKPDTYVDRGTVIALSGGRPGDEGAGLSSGPHLHFEVRNGGIPVNPENYLPSISGDDE